MEIVTGSWSIKIKEVKNIRDPRWSSRETGSWQNESELATSSRDPVHWETTLEAERSKSRRKREARIPTQAEDPETNYVISLSSPFIACIHLVMCSIFEVHVAVSISYCLLSGLS